MSNYEKLIERVRQIDESAADYLKTVDPGEPGTSHLSMVMIWEDTPQGWEYWNSINNILEMRR